MPALLYLPVFTDRAIGYLKVKNFDHLDVALSIGIQRMVQADVGGSGVMFSIDTDTGFPGAAVISAAWGLGETVVQGDGRAGQISGLQTAPGEPGCAPIIEKALAPRRAR